VVDYKLMRISGIIIMGYLFFAVGNSGNTGYTINASGCGLILNKPAIDVNTQNDKLPVDGLQVLKDLRLF